MSKYEKHARDASTSWMHNTQDSFSPRHLPQVSTQPAMDMRTKAKGLSIQSKSGEQGLYLNKGIVLLFNIAYLITYLFT